MGRGPIWNHWCWNNKCANVFLFLPPGPSGDVGEKGEIIVGSLVGAISPWVSCPRFAGACAKILVVGSCDSPAHVPSGTSSRQGHRPFGASGTMSPPAACSNDSFFCFGLVFQHAGFAACPFGATPAPTSPFAPKKKGQNHVLRRCRPEPFGLGTSPKGSGRQTKQALLSDRLLQTQYLEFLL